MDELFTPGSVPFVSEIETRIGVSSSLNLRNPITRSENGSSSRARCGRPGGEPQHGGPADSVVRDKHGPRSRSFSTDKRSRFTETGYDAAPKVAATRSEKSTTV